MRAADEGVMERYESGQGTECVRGGSVGIVQRGRGPKGVICDQFFGGRFVSKRRTIPPLIIISQMSNIFTQCEVRVDVVRAAMQYHELTDPIFFAQHHISQAIWPAGKVTSYL